MLKHGGRCRELVCLAWILEPLDHALQTIQSLSASPHGLLQMLRGVSPIDRAMSAYNTMLSKPTDAGSLSLLFWLFAGMEDGVDLEASVRQRILQIAGQMWWRFLPYGGWPFLLAPLGDPPTSNDERKQTAERFLMTPVCCLDAGFGQKAFARDEFPSERSC